MRGGWGSPKRAAQEGAPSPPRQPRPALARQDAAIDPPSSYARRGARRGALIAQGNDINGLASAKAWGIA